MWPSDPHGLHRAACGEAGVLGGRGFSTEKVAAQVCREGGGRVSTNVMVRDMDVPSVAAGDGGRLEIVVDSACSTGRSWPLTQLWCLR